MGRIDCRNSTCDATRSTTVCDKEGEHIPPCHICGDPAYVEPWADELCGDKWFRESDGKFVTCQEPNTQPHLFHGGEGLIWPNKEFYADTKATPAKSG